MIFAPQTCFRSLGAMLPACLICFFCGFSMAQADPAPSWTALPDETALVVRLPEGEAFMEALRKQTKLGAVILSQERFERVVRAIRDQSAEEWDSVREALGRVDLKPEDLGELFHGELGLAVTLEPRGDRAPLVVLLGWLEPGEDVAPRVLAALQSVLGEVADTPSAPVRKDIELAGHEVMHLQIPVPGVASAQVAERDDDDSEEGLEEDIEKVQKRLKNPPAIVADRVQLFVSRLGGRIVWGSTVPQSIAEVQKKSDAEREAIDWDELTGLEQATAVFGRFLAAHDGSSPGGVRRLLETPGLEPSLPAGTPLVELVADPRPLVKLGERASNPKVKQVLEALGAGGLGPIAIRMTIDGTSFRSGAFLSMPAPRPGLLSLVDQAKLDVDLPPWVPATAIGYQQMSFDLGDAYARIKVLATGLWGEPVKKGFDQMEGAAKLFIQHDITELLSALGSQHSRVTFAPRPVAATPKNAEKDEGENVSPAPAQRIGMVWRVKDEKDERVLKQFLKASTQMLQGGAGGNLKAVEELGFSGYRLDQNGTEVGIFLGNGYLVVGIGPEVSETLLVALRAPPEGSLRASGLIDRGRALIAPQPCLSYELADAGAGAKLTRETVVWFLEALITGNVPGFAAGAAQESEKALLEKLKALLPTEAEMEGVMGVKIGQTVVTDEGLMIQSALELPAP